MTRDLKFHDQLSHSKQQANGTKHGFLRSTTNRSADFMRKLLITYIRPILEFGSSIWNVGYVGDMNRLESVQRDLTKKITGLGDWSYEERLRHLDLYSVQGRLLRIDLVQCWKLFHDKAPFSPEKLFTLVTRVSRGHSYRIFKERFNTSVRQRFFTCRIVNEWNSLPAAVVDAPSLDSFKMKLADHLGAKLYEYNDS